MKNILLICGGGGSEHEISLISANYIESKIDKANFNVLKVVIESGKSWIYEGQSCQLGFNSVLIGENLNLKIHYAIPCIHGYPGETGDIQSYFEMINLPYLGCGPEASILAFNKLSTKLWLESAGIDTTPYIQISENDLSFASDFLKKHKKVVIKATNQGSSIGCYLVGDRDELTQKIKEAFSYSPFVIVEKALTTRELEVAAFEYEGKIHVSLPGEIICPDHFYSYEEKYSKNSKTKTQLIAENIPEEVVQKIQLMARQSFELLKLRALARIDFFYTNEGEVYINEINTFPGHTPISMFPMMMENSGVKYQDFINFQLEKSLLD